MDDIRKNEVQEVSENICGIFSRHGIDLPLSPTDINNLSQLKIYLTEKLKDMLDNNFILLVNTLYRIDVNEEKLNELFSNKNRDDIPAVLADLIIERQLQKIHYRKKYKEGNL